MLLGTLSRSAAFAAYRKHTAAEIKAKERAALQNKGGGSAGMEDRRGGKAGHAKFKCPSCGIQVRCTVPHNSLDCVDKEDLSAFGHSVANY